MSNTEMSRSPAIAYAPGPSPWYLTDKVVTPSEGFRWQPADRSGRETGGQTLLVNADSQVVAVFGYYNYVMRLDSNTLVVWNQKRRTPMDMPSPGVELFLIEPRKLSPLLGDLSTVVKSVDERETFFALGGGVSAKVILPTTDVAVECQAEFPDRLASIDELLILCHSSAIRDTPRSGDLALLIARPSRASYELYPQDWFNNAEMDAGYEWVTRVGRNVVTNHIEGEGFRIAPFILDDSLRQIIR
jgi:hypothetical protein